MSVRVTPARWTRTARLLATLTACAAVLAACAPTTRVVLLPDSGGKATAVVVRNADSEQVLGQPYATTQAREHGSLKAEASSAERVNKDYGDVIRLTPPAAATYTLQFLTGGATLTPQSQAELEAILTAAVARPGGEIIITGHTDTTGTPEANDRISQERANALRDLLVGRGFPQERIRAVGRGQRELLVQTGPGVDEAQNRRVSIVVR